MQLEISGLDLLFSDYASKADEVVIVAPYIKVSTLEWVLSFIKEKASIRVLTRASMQYFILGSSDIECWPVIWRKGGDIYIEQTLHAKYYRFDDCVLIGSANITERALNKSDKPNLELISTLTLDDVTRRVEKQLFAGRVAVDKSLYRRLKSAVDRYKKNKEVLTFKNKVERLKKRYEAELETVVIPDTWCFMTKSPVNLWIYYQDPSRLGKDDQVAAQTDLSTLRISPDDKLSERDFCSLVASRLRTWLLYSKLNQLFDENETSDYPYLRYGYIRDSLGLLDDGEHDSLNGSVNAFFNWMITFFPKEFFEAPRRHSRLLGRYEHKIRPRYLSNGA